MTISEIVIKNKLTVDDEILKLCEAGLTKMSLNPDPHHNVDHVYSILRHLDHFISKNAFDSKPLDYNVILPAICWHDVWKGSHTQTSNLLTFVYREIQDGRGSQLIFDQYVRENKIATKIDKEVLEKISYAIKYHSRQDATKFYPSLLAKLSLWLWPIKSVEAEILMNLDMLDAWDPERLRVLVDNYLVKRTKPFSPKYILIGKVWITNAIKKKETPYIRIPQIKERYYELRSEMIKAVIELWNSAEKYIDVRDEKNLKYMKLDSKVVENLKLRDYVREVHKYDNFVVSTSSEG